MSFAYNSYMHDFNQLIYTCRHVKAFPMTTTESQLLRNIISQQSTCLTSRHLLSIRTRLKFITAHTCLASILNDNHIVSYRDHQYVIISTPVNRDHLHV